MSGGRLRDAPFAAQMLLAWKLLQDRCQYRLKGGYNEIYVERR